MDRFRQFIASLGEQIASEKATIDQMENGTRRQVKCDGDEWTDITEAEIRACKYRIVLLDDLMNELIEMDRQEPEGM